MAELAILLAQSIRGQQVNSVFGEGVNPRLRKIRDGLEALDLPTDEPLNHGGPRLVCGAELIENTRSYLLGIDKSRDRSVAPDESNGDPARVWPDQAAGNGAIDVLVSHIYAARRHRPDTEVFDAELLPLVHDALEAGAPEGPGYDGWKWAEVLLEFGRADPASAIPLAASALFRESQALLPDTIPRYLVAAAEKHPIPSRSSLGRGS